MLLDVYGIVTNRNGGPQNPVPMVTSTWRKSNKLGSILDIEICGKQEDDDDNNSI